MAEQAYTPGDVNISVFITDLNSTKFVNITDLVQLVDIYESVSSPLIRGKIMVLDSLNIRESFPLIRQKCKVSLHFNVPSSKGISGIERIIDLLVQEVSNITINENSTSSSYELDLVSIEILNNAKNLFTVAMRNQSIDTYINYIMSEFIKSKKSIYFDPSGTKGEQYLDPINVKPFQAIDMLRRKAVSKKYLSSSYTFFENRMGFNFLTAEYMLERPNGLLKDATFFFDSDVATSVKNMTYRNIIAYTHMSQSSTTKLLQDGALNNVVRSVDLRTRTKKKVNTKLSDVQNQFSTGGKIPINESKFEQEYGTKHTSTYNLIKSSSNPENYLDDKIGPSKTFVSLLTQNIVRILTWGDNMLSSGFRVKCTLPTVDGKTSESGKKDTSASKMVSGEYLIWHIRHIMEKQSLKKFIYKNSMELVKASYSELKGYGDGN